MHVTHFLLTIFAAACLITGLPPVGFFPLSWISWLFLFLIFFSPKCSAGSLIFFTYLTGLLYFSIALKWLLENGMELYLSGVFAFGTLFPVFFIILHLIRLASGRNGTALIAAPLLWGLILTGFRFLPYGMIPAEAPFYGPVIFHQASNLGFYWLLPAVILSLNASAAYYFHERSAGKFLLILFWAAALGSLWYWGRTRMQETPLALSGRYAMIQHHLLPAAEASDAGTEETIKAYKEYALLAAKLEPDMILFPFYRLPLDPFHSPGMPSSLARSARKPVLLAARIPGHKNEKENKMEPRNMAFLFMPDGKINDAYQSTAEIPLLSGIEDAAESYRIIEGPHGKIGILLNFEDIRPHLALEAKKKGAEMLVVLADTNSLKNALLPGLLLFQDQLRAIETGLPLLRVSAHGYSAYIDRMGRIQKMTEINEETILLVGEEEEKTE